MRQRPFLVALVGLGGSEAEGRRYQKLEGEYLFATRRIARVVSESVGKTEKVAEG